MRTGVDNKRPLPSTVFSASWLSSRIPRSVCKYSQWVNAPPSWQQCLEEQQRLARYFRSYTHLLLQYIITMYCLNMLFFFIFFRFVTSLLLHGEPNMQASAPVESRSQGAAPTLIPPPPVRPEVKAAHFASYTERWGQVELKQSGTDGEE